MIRTGILIIFFLTTLHLQGQEIKHDTLYSAAKNAFKEGQKERALELYEKIYKNDPKQVLALEWITFLYYDLDQFEKAAVSGSELCRVRPNNPNHFSNTCYYYTLIGKPEKGEPYGKRAVELDAYQFTYLVNLGHTYLTRKRKTEAAYWYIKAMQWMSKKEDFEESLISDLNYLKSKNLISKEDANSFIEALSGEFKLLQKALTNNQLLDSILWYHRKKTSYNERVIEYKKEFVLLEAKSDVVRFNVVANFLTDIGMYEFGKRNRAMAMDIYFDMAEKMYINDADSLGQAKFLIHLSKELLSIIGEENKFSKNSAALEYALDAKKLVEENNLYELEVACLMQLSKCYVQNKEGFLAKNTLHYLLNRSNFKMNLPGIVYAAKGLSEYFQKDYKPDSAIYYNQLALQYLNDPEIPVTLAAKIKFDEISLLIEADKIELALEKGKLELLKLHQYEFTGLELSNLYECLSIACFENSNFVLSYDYADSAISSYVDYLDNKIYHPSNRPPQPLSIVRKISLNLLSNMGARAKISDELFFWMELKKDGFLSARLKSALQNAPYIVPLKEVRKTLSNDVACISYSGTSGTLAVGMAFDSKGEIITEFSIEHLMKEFRNKNVAVAASFLSETAKKLGYPLFDSALTVSGLPVIQYYLLSNRDPKSIRGIAVKPKGEENTTALISEGVNISKVLYNIYVKPFESLIEGKKKLIICADEMLQIFPFESLVMPDGRYLGEVFEITYTPGFSILKYLSMRSYNENKKMITFGNPDYSEYHPENLTGRALDYSLFGIKSWTELPGTQKELSAIDKTFNVVISKTGQNLSETILKEMSRNGSLRESSILHFALHGIAGPASSKEDNSLVVTEPDGGNEDGLLQFSEALNLNLNAELACLSACESGINQIEGDGSMVTIGTAFMAAGAKAVIVTNWSIDDEATATFMSEFYSRVLKHKIPFSKALAETKQKFIRGDFGEKYRKPLYWAPFKYYGL